MKRFIITSLLPLSLLALTAPATAGDGEALAKKSGCFSCHAMDKTIVGPSWNDVAEKYKDDPNAHEILVTSILEGSQGKWGKKVHMTAQKKVPREDVETLVSFIMSLSK